MPKKHVLSFKHLISTSSATALGDEQESHRSNPTSGLTVQELLDRSRSARPARPIPGLSWNPPLLPGRIDLDADGRSGDVHPAEQLRRAQVAHRQAQRSVAGPAPPPSWRSQPSTNAGPSRLPIPSQPVTDDDLIEATRLFSDPARPSAQPRTEIPRLVDHCFRAVLRYLDSEDVVWTYEDSQSRVTLGRLLRDNVPYLDQHLRMGILAAHATRTSPRLSDRSIRSLLAPAQEIASNDKDDDRAEIEFQEDEWDDTPSSELVHHLGITLHPSPHPLLRSIILLPTVALTSLNLAYSTIPRNLEKLISALPTGLRELGLAGVRCASELDWSRFLASLGRRLIVLRMLDLSYPPSPIDQPALEILLHPPSRQLPSLRTLGLRGNRAGADIADLLERLQKLDLEEDHMEGRAVVSNDMRKQLLFTIRKDRQRFVDVIWE